MLLPNIVDLDHFSVLNNAQLANLRKKMMIIYYNGLEIKTSHALKREFCRFTCCRQNSLQGFLYHFKIMTKERLATIFVFLSTNLFCYRLKLFTLTKNLTLAQFNV